MNRIAIGLLGMALSLSATPAFAQEAPGTIALSAEDRAAVLDAAANRPESELPINGLDRQIHGEVGMEIGSRGGRALYGSTIVPLGDNATAAFSFMTGQQGRWR
ncbi:hypothetical protein Q4F19_02165 [Sphingomonas sp. BIUV-7]|uniref:Uncharacterized protein n=1 Tax=Sphingomonas natans TaxID=3063330 RepID=A0ABT8Y4D3_9SPHN|nr:hypothetical protein [Sphingomonas sp. BIUV-7]MDO6413177.1 hypothetical protein [Sphingomonas sp. BIUV-7]